MQGSEDEQQSQGMMETGEDGVWSVRKYRRKIEWKRNVEVVEVCRVCGTMGRSSVYESCVTA
jgi:hypothetical protein